MSEARAPDSKYHVEIRDARGVVIGDNNIVYQYFLDERYRPLAEHLITFDDLIAERTADFVGRTFLDVRLAAFMEQHDRGYFVLVGEPGIGKTAWAAHIVREHQALHHFNISAMGIVRPDQALENLCAQLIARFQLDQPYLPVNAGRDGSLLDKLLRQAAERLDGSKLVIVIDALDEAQLPADTRGANALYLPSSLTAGVYFVLTRRPQPMSLETAPGTHLETFTLGAELPDNQTDVRTYLRQQAGKPEVASRLTDRHIPTERFIEELAERSTGNFMYLAYLLPDIAGGLLDPLNLSGLPQGVRGYYGRFWDELEKAKGEGREAWTRFYKPVIGILAAAREPVSAKWISRILALDPEEVTDFALARWCKFLHQTDVASETYWRLYHASFADFLVEKLGSTKRYHDQIADHYRKSCDGNWLALIKLDGAYGLRHLATHFAGAQRWEDLHGLVAQGQDGYLIWAEAHHDLDGSFEGYLTDLEIAWEHSDEEVMYEIKALGRQIRYALIEASIHSLAESISPELLGALVQYEVPGWTPSSALGYCRAIPDEQQRAECISTLAPTLDTDMLYEALLIAEAIKWTGARVHALSGLMPYISDDQRKPILEQVLADAASIKHEPERTLCQILLLPFLPAEVQAKRSHSLLRRIASAKMDRGCVGLLGLLASRVAPDLLADALNIVQSIENDTDCAQALVALAPHLPQELVPWAYSFAENLEREYPRWLALAALAPRLSSSHRCKAMEQVLISIQEMEVPFTRSEVLATLIAHSGTAQLRSAYAEASRILDNTSEPGTEIRLILALMPHLSSIRRQDVLAKVLGSKQIIDDESWQAEILVALLLYLPSSRLQQEVIALILELARNSEWDDERVRLSSSVIHFLEEPDRELEIASLLKLAESIYENDSRIAGIAAIAQVVPHLSGKIRAKVTERTFQSIGSIRTEFRARCLSALVPVLPLSERRQAIDELLDLAANTKNEYERAELLSEVIPYLSKRRIKQLLSEVAKIRNESARVETMARLASHLPDNLITPAVAVAETIKDEDDRSFILCAMGQHSLTSNAGEALAQATASARRWSEYEPRAKALQNLVPAWLRLVQADRAEALKLFKVQLRQMAAQSRFDLMTDLRVFVPVIMALAGQEAVIDMTTAVLDVCRWWP